MLQTLLSIIQALTAISPLGQIALLIVVILLMVHEKGPIGRLSNNHLEHVQESLDKIAANSDKQLEAITDIAKDISYVKGKLDR